MSRDKLSRCKKYYQAAMLSDKFYALINMNIKKFRYMNYAYGKKEADKILQDLENTIKKFLADNEIIVRGNADDFFLLVSYISKKDFERNRLI